jgi:predicted nucleic acid-binding protein
MVRFWDTSAIVPLLVEEPMARAVTAALEVDPEIGVWWATSVECTSAIARQEREESLGTAEVSAALARLDALTRAWDEVLPSARVKSTADRLCRTHPLRAADALQLAAAIVMADGEPSALSFVTLDDRLGVAATREGFPVEAPT